MRKPSTTFHRSSMMLAAAILASPAALSQSRAADTGAAPARPPPAQATLRPCDSVTVDPPITLALGKSQVVRLPFPAVRMVVGGQPTGRAGPPEAAPAAGAARAAQRPQGAGAGSREWDGVAGADITLLSPTELYFLGRQPGSMNVVLQAASGRCVVKDLIVTVDPDTIQAKLAELLPEEKGVRVRAAERAVVLTGTVSDSIKLEQILSVAAAYGDGKKVVNLLRVNAPQQVMLEVKIAEVSKNILDHLDLDFARLITSGSSTKIISGIVGAGAAAFGRFSPGMGDIIGNAAGAVSGSSGAATASTTGTARGATLFGIDGQKKDGIVRILAEPNIMAISGQTASFLSGGKIFIPVAQDRSTGGVTITLEEKEFGVGLKFTPTVLDGSRINLKLVTESSELSQSGSPFTSLNGVTAILPSMATRRVDTTVQLNDGQSFVVAGLIKNNLNAALAKIPGLGEVPLMGALFRSTEFQNDQTELMFVVTPRLVKPLVEAVALPTDSHVAPTRNDVMLRGAAEGTPPAPPASAPRP